MAAFWKSREPGSSPENSLVGAAHIDGDVARLVVAETVKHGPDLSVVSYCEGLHSEFATLVDGIHTAAGGTKRRAAVEWVTTLSGDDALHDVRNVPPQVRSFDEAVRLDAVLAGSQWGNVAAMAASGYSVGSAFRGDQCLIAVARTETLHDNPASTVGSASVSTDAFGLLSLVERVRPDVIEPSAGPTLAILCNTSSVAMCAIGDGVVRLLHQSSLVERMRLAKPLPSAVSAGGSASAELEYEFGGSYAIPSGAGRVQPLAEIRAAEVETSVYQSALLHLIDEALGLASEAEPFSPDLLLVTGDAVHRHAVVAYLRNCFGSSVILDELDAALAVRIDEPGLAREMAAQQAQYAGALAALAAAMARAPLRFQLNGSLDESATELAGRAGLRSRALTGTSRALVVFILVLLVTGGGLGTGRWIHESRRRAATALQLDVERQRNRELSAVAAEWKEAETRLAHTRALLDTINGYRQRQQSPPRLLTALRSLLPSDASLTELSFNAGVVKITGFCETRDLGPTVALAMEQNRDNFAEVTPRTNTAKMKLPDPETGEEAETTVHTFAITARYVGGEAR